MQFMGLLKLSMMWVRMILDTDFRLNVKGTTAFPGLNIIGTITAEAAGTASKTMYSLCGVLTETHPSL